MTVSQPQVACSSSLFSLFPATLYKRTHAVVFLFSQLAFPMNPTDLLLLASLSPLLFYPSPQLGLATNTEIISAMNAGWGIFRSSPFLSLDPTL